MNRFSLMGIVNITPDSFSDGGYYNRVETCCRHLSRLIEEGADYLDIGAESSAPINSPISFEEEKERLEKIFFPAIKGILKSLPPLSIDTYRPETFKWCYEKLKNSGFEKKIVWNDVGGVLDRETLETLSYCRDADYIYTHNPVENRKQTGNHDAFVRDGLGGEELWQEINKYFLKGQEALAKIISLHRVWIDPGMGFGKNVDQNWYLTKNIHKLAENFSNRRLLLGISRKRFLWAKADSREEVEILQALIYNYWRKLLPTKKTTLRLHQLKTPQLVENCRQLLE